MPETEIDIVPPTLPEGCFPLTQAQVNLLFQGLRMRVPQGLNGIVFSPTEPAAEQRDKLWLKTDINNDVTGEFYYSEQFSKWLWPVGKVYSTTDRRILFVQSESEIWNYDGGDGTNPSSSPPTATTGAMWEADHSFDAKFILGAGTFPSSTVVAPKATGGEETVGLTLAQLPSGFSIPKRQTPEGPNPFLKHDTNQELDIGVSRSAENDIKGEDKKHNNIPPYIAVMIAKRTIRQFYTP